MQKTILKFFFTTVLFFVASGCPTTPQEMENNINIQEEKAVSAFSHIDYDGVIVQEEVPFQRHLKFFSTRKGTLLGYLAKSRIASKLMGWAQNRQTPLTLSWRKFVERHEINLDECEIPEGGYKTFNDFFTRKLKPGARIIDPTPHGIASPADSKCTFVEDISKKDVFVIKSSRWTLKKMLADKELAKEYEGGTLINFRLAPEDYHRFHFPIDCTPTVSRKIRGTYDSVNPYAFKIGGNPLGENARNIVVLKSTEFHDPLCVIVGAMGVGKIIETYTPETLYKKGAEMGYFEFGASTICLVFKAGVLKASDRKFVDNSKDSIETAVKQGRLIGIRDITETHTAKEINPEQSTFFSISKITDFFKKAKKYLVK